MNSARSAAGALSATAAVTLDELPLREELRGEEPYGAPQLDVAVPYGSSGNFYSEIRNQAPFDVFLSADSEYPRKLAQEGYADARSMFIYGVGRIVVWAPQQSPLDLARLHDPPGRIDERERSDHRRLDRRP